MSEYGDDRYRSAGRAVWLLRVVLVAATGAAVWFALEIRPELGPVGAPSARLDDARFWAAIGLFVLAGFTFGIAVRYPFPRPRLAWGRIVFVVVMLLPAAHLWITLAEPFTGLPGWVLRRSWFDAMEVVDLGATLAGVAAASALGARRRI